MSAESLVDEVRARLARERPEESHGFEDLSKEPEVHGLELADLNTIANRHFYAGRYEGSAEGYERGVGFGTVTGRERQRQKDTLLFRAVTGTLGGRLARICQELQEPASGAHDRRTKTELCERALYLVEEVRAGLGVVMAKVAAGEFDDGE